MHTVVLVPFPAYSLLRIALPGDLVMPHCLDRGSSLGLVGISSPPCSSGMTSVMYVDVVEG